MARFTAIPNIPAADVPYWQSQTLNAMKQNVELLTGIGGELDGASRAITKGSVTVSNTPAQTMTQVTARGTGFTISEQSVASLEDYGKLISNVQSLANDVATLRNYVNTLITQLRG
jgi:hypothetical protein